jgi:hypothetical protein
MKLVGIIPDLIIAFNDSISSIDLACEIASYSFIERETKNFKKIEFNP